MAVSTGRPKAAAGRSPSSASAGSRARVPSSTAGSGAVAARYRELVASGEISTDPAQAALAARFDRLNDELAERRLARKSSPLGWLFAARRPASPRGLYIYGEVGRGKSMLMDAFFAV